MKMYQINFNQGGSTETYDLDEAKRLKLENSQGATIVELDRTYSIHGAPQLGVFDMPDDADQALRNVQDDTFYREERKVQSVPQPEGLND